MTNNRIQTCILSLVAIAGSLLAGGASAQQLTCKGLAPRVTAVALPGDPAITTRFQLDEPNLEPLLAAAVTVGGEGASCLVAELSALTRITDNYVVYQVLLDGVAMLGGQVGGWFGVPDPVIPVPFDDEDEQFVDPYRIVSHSFIAPVQPGRHVVEVLTAAGSGIAPGQEPRVIAPVLTVRYR